MPSDYMTVMGSSAGVGRRTGSRVKCLTKQTEWLQRTERESVPA